MTEISGAPVANIYRRWMRQLRLTATHVHRFSGCSLNTWALILNGTTTRPTVRTLKKTARALATDPYAPHDVDPVLETVIRDELLLAAGYTDPVSADPETLLRYALFALTGRREQADAWAETLRTLRTLSPAQIRALPRAVLPAPEHAERHDPVEP